MSATRAHIFPQSAGLSPSLGARLVRLYLGLAAFGLSLALMVRADLGLGPWDVLHQGIARHLNMQLGWVTIGVSALVVLAWIPLRQRPGVGTVSNIVVVGLAVNVSLDQLPDVRVRVVQIALLLGAIMLNAIATALYIGADLGPGPRDGLMTGLAGRGHSIRAARTATEVLALTLGIVLGGSYGVGTVLYALSIGPLVQRLMPLLSTRRPTGGS